MRSPPTHFIYTTTPILGGGISIQLCTVMHTALHTVLYIVLCMVLNIVLYVVLYTIVHSISILQPFAVGPYNKRSRVLGSINTVCINRCFLHIIHTAESYESLCYFVIGVIADTQLI